MGFAAWVLRYRSRYQNEVLEQLYQFLAEAQKYQQQSYRKVARVLSDAYSALSEYNELLSDDRSAIFEVLVH